MKSTLVLGIGLLLVAVVTGLISTLSVHNFTTGHDVQADKRYYLLADQEALAATSCAALNAEGQDVSSVIAEAEAMVDSEEMEISNVALPFTQAKGVYATVTFTEGVAGARYACDRGTNYISTLSGGTLQALRWVTMLTAVAGIAMVLTALLTPALNRGERGRG